MFTYKPPSVESALLRLLDYAIDEGTYSDVLETIAQGIRKAERRISEADATGQVDYVDAVVDSEAQIIEDLLGAAVVVCQAQITAVTQAALRARRQVIAGGGHSFSGFGNGSHEVRQLGERFSDPQYSKIEVLWALANYFKHRDEWSSDTWVHPSGLSQYTIPVLQSAGLAASPAGNLQTGAAALGCNCANLSVFVEIVQAWAEEVRRITKRELGR